MKSIPACVALVALVFCLPLWSQSTTCTSPSYIVPDGREVESSFAANTYWFAFHGMAGHCYVLEYGAFHSNNNSVFVSPAIYAPTDTPCTGGGSTLTISTTTYVDPYIGDGGSSRRRSWIAPSEGNYFISLTSSGSEDIAYRVIDTTMYQPAWSTFSSHYTQAAIKNTTGSTVSCTYTATITSGGSGAVSRSFDLSPGGSIFPVISPGGFLSISANKAGDAALACTGAPGSIMGNAYIFNSSATVVQPVTLAPRDAQR
jgi:hypothetical protein